MEIKIDGKTCECQKDEYVLQVALRNGIDIPYLCHHPAVPGRGCCRVCIVEAIERGRSKVVTACVYPVKEGLEIETNTPRIQEERAMILAFMSKRAHESDKIMDMCKKYGAPQVERIPLGSTTKCILCGLCVTACRAMGTGAISTVDRGVEKRIATPYDEPTLECIGCLSCAHICPTGNIEYTDEGTAGEHACSGNAPTRSIWGREFTMATCEECGALLGATDETYAYAAKKSELGEEVHKLCTACRQKHDAKRVADALRV